MGRVFRDLSLVAVVAALSFPGLAAAEPKAPLRLAPSSKWFLNYAKDSCRIARRFGTGDQEVTLILERYQPGDSFRLSFVGNPARTDGDGDVQIRFGPTEAMQEIAFYPAKSEDKTAALVLRSDVRIAPLSKADLATHAAAADAGQTSYRVAPITPEQETAVSYVEVRHPVREPFLLETGSLGNPFAALRQCTDELLDHWGIDVAKHAKLSRPVMPKGDPAKWIRPDEYPAPMLHQGMRAIIQFRLDVDVNGAPTGCHIQNSYSEQFDETVCKALMRRATFDPALDADGHPLASYWMRTVNFHM